MIKKTRMGGFTDGKQTQIATDKIELNVSLTQIIHSVVHHL